MPRPTNVLDVSGSLNTRHTLEKRRYDRLLRGEALKSEVGESKLSTDSNTLATSPSWTQTRANKHHGFVIAALSSSVDELSHNAYLSGTSQLETTAVPASASAYYGKRRVIKRTYKITGSENNFSYPDYNDQYIGGNDTDGFTDPISGTIFLPNDYIVSRQIPRRNDDVIGSQNQAAFPILVEDYGKLIDIKVWVELVTKHGYVVAAASPDYANTDNGQLNNENFFIPTSRSVDLSTMTLCLLPPNTPLREEIGPRFTYPGWNDEQGFDALRSVNSRLVNQDGIPPHFPGMGGPLDPFYVPRVGNDSTAVRWDGVYVLWEGKNAFLDVSDATWGRNLSRSIAPAIVFFIPGSSSIYQGYSINSGSYANWDTDFNIRTVFSDDAPTPNPLHLESLYNLASSSVSISPVSVLSGNSPNYNGLKIYSGAFYGQPLTASAYGNEFPWFVDDRLVGYLGTIGSASSPVSGWNNIGFPPEGWLTGGRYVVTSSLLAVNAGMSNGVSGREYAALQVEASGFVGGVMEEIDDGQLKIYYKWYAMSASDNEWPTRGRNLGPSSIKPVLPLLDDVYTETVYRHPISSQNDPTDRNGGTIGVRSTLNQSAILRGFRPGLRGTEVNGWWCLLINIPSDYYNGAFRYGAVYFRQWRLELTFEQGEGLNEASYASRDRRAKKVTAGRKSGKRLVHVMSGSRAFTFHHGVEKYYVVDQPEYGRSVGITSDTGSINDFAVFTRMTGSLSDRFSGSAGFFSSFLTNEFGTPYVPVSSGSGEPTSNEILDDKKTAKEESKAVHEAINPRTLVPRASTMKSTLARTEYSKSTADRAASRLSKIRSPVSGSG